MVSVNSSVLTIISILLVGVVLLLTDFSQFPTYVASNQGIIALLLFLGVVTFFLRMLRNYSVFRVAAYTDVSLLHYLPAGMLAGVVSIYGPLKSGELVAMEIYRENFSVQRGESLSVIAVGRIFDVVIILSFVSTSLLLLPSSEVVLLYTYLAVLISILAVVIAALVSKRVGLALLRITRPLFIWKLSRIHSFVENLANDYYRSLMELKDSRIFSLLTLTTAGRWGLELVGFSMLMNSFGIRLNILQLMSVLGFSYAIGVSSGTPGALGSSQLTALGILVLLGADAGTAGLALVINLAISTVLYITLLLISLLWLWIQNGARPKSP